MTLHIITDSTLAALRVNHYAALPEITRFLKGYTVHSLLLSS